MFYIILNQFCVYFYVILSVEYYEFGIGYFKGGNYFINEVVKIRCIQNIDFRIFLFGVCQ